ncbi:MAG TPA: DUF6510 family protein [Haliangiales bacterium]|nr:DUF6510 family protein [Haliangiales bacterium]
MTRTGDELRLDGNAAAGFLGELFTFDITRATATCDGCGGSSAVGALVLYAQEMGAVLRCPGCSHLLMCVTRPHGAWWIDLRGVRILRVAAP